MDPLIIEVAVNGGSTKARNPHTPVTPDEVAADSLACLAAGAAIVHTHIADIGVKGPQAAEEYAKAFRAILKERPDAILYGTGARGGTVEEKCEHTEILGKAGLMRMGFVDPGSTQLGSADEDGLPKGPALYANPCDEIAYRFEQTRRLRLGPNMAMYEPGFLQVALAWHRAGKLPPGALVKFYLGGGYNYASGRKGPDFWGLPATAKALDAYLELLELGGGADLPWMTTVLGGDITASGMTELTIAKGGHIRLGLEDYGGPRQPSNVELIEEVTALAKKAGRPIATTAQTAAILKLPDPALA
jgi:3-keto-5-aminohexanoate cleavage enzyme